MLILPASVAKVLSKISKDNKIISQKDLGAELYKIGKKVKEATRKGEYSINLDYYYDKDFQKEIFKLLKKEGYEIQDSGLFGTGYNLIWV